MLKSLWKKIRDYQQNNKTASLEEISAATGAPVSTVAYHKSRVEKRKASSGTDQWETALLVLLK